MSQPCERNCNVTQPGEIDEQLNEFWVGNPFDIFMHHNLSCYERNRLFLNSGSGQFVDVSFSAGVDSDADGRSSLTMDIDNDGMMDLVLRQAGGGSLVILRNTFPPANFLKVTLRGTRSNRQGIGARLVASVDSQTIVREVYPTNTYRSQRPLAAHFGMQQASKMDSLQIRWPSGLEQTVHNIAANLHVVITEGEDTVTTVVPGQTIEP